MILKDCLEKIIDNRGRNPKYYDREVYPVIDNVMIKNNYHPNINEATRFIDQDTHDNFLRGYLESNIPIMTLVGGGIGNVSLSIDDKSVIVQNTIGFKTKPELLDSVYLYYWFLYKHDELIQFNRGSGQPSIRKTDIENMNIELKSINYQRKVSKVLSEIDEKIDLNNKINNNLYELCRKIFEQTFNYDMSFESLDTLCSEITRGYTKNYVEKSNLINLNQKVNKGQNLEKQYYKYLDENQDIPKNRYVRKNDILLNSLGQGTLGRVHLFEENVNNVVIDQHISILRTGARISPYYLYYLLSSNEYQNKIENSVTGTTGMLMLNISVVRSFKIPVPNKKDIDYFDSIAKVCMDKITINTLENEKLIELRDILLPKLMNGEIDLDNIEI